MRFLSGIVKFVRQAAMKPPFAKWERIGITRHPIVVTPGFADPSSAPI
jgi:hypothetical protein